MFRRHTKESNSPKKRSVLESTRKYGRIEKPTLSKRNWIDFLRKKRFIFIVCLLLISSFLNYFISVNLHPQSHGEFIRNIPKMIFFVFFSSISFTLSFHITLFLSRSHLSVFQKSIFFSLHFFVLILIWIVDQGKAEGLVFRYGYYASRGYIGIVFGLCSVSLFVIFSFKISKRSRICLYVIISLVIFSIFIILFRRYEQRVQIFNQGIYGRYNIQESSCSVDNDLFQIGPLVPRFLFHLILLTYWCKKEPVFTEIIENEKEETVVEVQCQSTDYIEVTLFPRIHEFTFDELKWDNYLVPGGKCHLQASLLNRVEKIRLPPSTSDYKATRRVSYDGHKYETAVIGCSHSKSEKVRESSSSSQEPYKKNLIVHPHKRIDDSELLDLTTENPNLISIWFDSASRKTLEYDLQDSFSYLRKLRDSTNFEVFEFFNLHILSCCTIPSTTAAFTGYWSMNRKENDSVPLWHTEIHKKRELGLKRRLTVFSDDECAEWSSWVGKNKFGTFFADFLHVESFCNLEYVELHTRKHDHKGPYCPARKCLFQYEAPEIVFDYLKKIDQLYPTKSKFLNAGLQDGHEPTSQSLQYVDRYLLEYLRYLESEEVIEKSILFFFSDHGNSEGYLAKVLGSKEGKQGFVNPGLHVVIPTAYLEKRAEAMGVEVGKLKEILRKNQQRLITFYDFHKTWWNILGMKEEWIIPEHRNKIGIDLFSQEVPFERTAKQAGFSNVDYLIGEC